MVAKSISHHLEAVVETITFVGVYRGILILRFLRWCKISSIHSTILMPSSRELLKRIDMIPQETHVGVRRLWGYWKDEHSPRTSARGWQITPLPHQPKGG